MAMCISFGLDVGNPYMLEDKKFIWLLGSSFIGATILCFIICVFTSKLLVKILEKKLIREILGKICIIG